MVSCVACGEMTRNSCSCDHCGTKLRSCSSAQSMALAAVGALLMGCSGSGPLPQPAYGVALSDQDGDGYYEGEDCDDTNADIHPGAPETAGDGVDSDCDGEDDPVQTA